MQISALDFVARLFGISVAVGLDPLALVLVFGVARRVGAINDPLLMSPAFGAFASDSFLLIVGILYVLHALADKLPFAAHALDAIHVLFKPLAVALIAFSMSNALDYTHTLHIVTLAVIITGSVAVTTAVHVGRSALRLTASVASFGFLHPFISTAENIGALAFSTFVVLRPEIALLLIVLFTVPMYLIVRRATKWRRGRRGARLARSAAG